MRLQKWGILALPIMLTGCLSTPKEARNDSPRFEGVSNKPPEVIAECIYEAWSNTRVMLERDNTPHIERLSGKITIFTWRDTMFADVYPTASGSKIRFYKTFGMGYTIENNRREIVESCL